MPSHESHTARPIDWFVAATIITLLVMLLSPSLAQDAGDARLNGCFNHSKLLALGLLNYEAARKCNPGASTAEWSVPPGNDVDTKRAGYSWHTQILPFMEDQKLYKSVRDASANFTKAPFTVRVANGKTLAASVPVANFICPGFAGQPVVDVATSGYKVGDGGAPALTNYFALSSTHLLKDDSGRWGLDGAEMPALHLRGNGVLAFFSQSELDSVDSFLKLRGTTLASIRDGTSKTLVFGESREQAYAAWIDGQVTWVVAAWPQNPEPPQPLKNAVNPNAPATLGWPQDQLAAVVSPLAKQRFGVTDEEAGVYLPEAMWSGWSDRKFGPSGNHAGVAVHTFADGHSKSIAETIDPTVYLHLVTRAGQEIINDADR